MLAVSGQNGAGHENIRPTPKAAPESPVISGFFEGKCSHISPGISAYIPAVFSASRLWHRPRSSSVCAYPGERPCRRRGKSGFPGPGRLASVRPPAQDQGAERPPGSSGKRPPSSTCPAYSNHSPAAGSRILCHSWRTTLSPACGSWPFPRGSSRLIPRRPRPKAGYRPRDRFRHRPRRQRHRIRRRSSPRTQRPFAFWDDRF